MNHLYPFETFWWAYLVFSVVVGVLLFLSLKAFHSQPHAVSIRQASISAIGWFIAAMIFAVLFYFFTVYWAGLHPNAGTVAGLAPEHAAERMALEFVSGYLVEKALAVDNLFVFIVIFRFFSIPAQYQHRVLFYGLFGAIVLRAIFIAIGSVVMNIHLIVIGFGLFLMYQGWGALKGHDPDLDPENNRVLKFIRRRLPVTPTLHGHRFFVIENSKFMVTPLFVALIFIEITDIMFAFDSVPAIFGLTKEPLIVFTSNIFAVIDLRALYFLLAAFIDKFRFLNVGLALVLIFIGAKMAFLDTLVGGKFPTDLSLTVVLVLIIGSILFSLLRPPPEDSEKTA